jgi:hypothetical protein
MAGSTVTDRLAEVVELVVPDVEPSFNQVPSGITVVASAVQFSVPGPPFRISIVPAGVAIPLSRALKVSPLLERTISGAGVNVMVTGTRACCPSTSVAIVTCPE